MKIDEIKDAIQTLLKQVDKTTKSAEKVLLACNKIDLSWSGSDLPGHADLFYGDFDVPPHNRRFSIEWGLIHGLPSGWYEKSGEEVLQKIEKDSGVSLKKLDNDVDLITDEFEKLKKQTIIIFSEFSKEAAEEIERFNIKTKTDIFNEYWNRKIITRDTEALFAGRKIPTHKYYWASASFFTRVGKYLNDFLYLIDKVVVQYKNSEQKTQNKDTGRTAYVDKNTLLRLSRIENNNFDLSRLISFCNELDDNSTLTPIVKTVFPQF